MCLRSLLATSNRGNIRGIASKDDSDGNKREDELKIPEAPTTCCMSGCPNCVWLEYAEKLTETFKDSGESSRDIILSKVEDENMRAFLKMELNFLTKRLEQKNKDDTR